MSGSTSPKKKKTTNTQLKSFLFSYNTSGSELAKLEADIKEQNNHTLKVVSPISAVLFLLMTLLAFFLKSWGEEWVPYLVAMVEMLLIAVYEWVFIQIFPKIQTVVMYLFLTSINLFAIWLGTYGSPGELAVIYLVMLLGQSILLIDIPVRIMGFQLASMILFSVCAVIFKKDTILITDLIDTWCIGILSLGTGNYMISSTVKRILTEYKLENLGIIDQLTGLRNRNCYEQELGKYPHKAKFSLGCVFMDVNGLHALNDKEGHDAGDRMLQFMAYGFQKAFGEKSSYRIGGDEFVAVTVDMGVDEINEKIHMLRSAFTQRDYHAAIGYSFTGVSRSHAESVDILNLIKSAEEKMYLEKEEYYRTTGLDVRSQRDAVMLLKEQTRTLAFIEADDLTGLYTKQAFFHHAQILLRRNPDIRYSLIMFDIDNFKYVNERYGEMTGDRILRKIGNQIKTGKKPDTLAGRYSGDNFVILVEQGKQNTEDMISYYSSVVMKALDIQKVALKFGIYDDVEHNVPVSVLCDRVKMALRRNKQYYGTAIARYDKAFREKIDWENKLEQFMEAAVKENQFQVYYQPKHDAKSGRLIGAEALVRWVHPELGFISPGDFIPLFERNGFITEADYYVWENVCRDLRAWMDAGMNVVPVSVNGSKLDFAAKDYVERLHKPVDAYHVPKQYLHIEVTESLVSENIDELEKLLEKLRAEGFQIEMDDFGKGYSSLNTLGTLSLDVVKLDMSFISQIGNERKLRILAAMISLAKNLKLHTVAEGVETEEQLKVLKELGCDAIQGYYFSKPLPKEQFTEYLNTHTK